ncbi:MAG: hypothetical protein AB7V46_11995 [Thermomicrobiales bacterium]
MKHLSASEAVNTIRDISSNAFLYTHFCLDGRWGLADKIRESDWSKVDEVEEEALQIAKDIVRGVAAKRKSDADDVRITKAAAKYAMSNEAIMDLARSAVQRRKDIAPSWWILTFSSRLSFQISRRRRMSSVAADQLSGRRRVRSRLPRSGVHLFMAVGASPLVR